ncbi:MAG: universal stress protein [Thermoplasmata archaeon]
MAETLRCTWEWPPDLIVVGTRGRTGARRILLGSVSVSVARRTKVPLILVHSTGATTRPHRAGSTRS